MRVICVHPIVNIDENCKNWPRPEVGDIDIVVNQKEIFGHMYYSLERFEKRNGFLAECFATLPEPDADEMKEAEHEAIVNLETA